jgi:hypothetical protein
MFRLRVPSPVPYCTAITTTLLLHRPSMLTRCYHTATIFPLPLLQGLSLRFSALLSPFPHGTLHEQP